MDTQSHSGVGSATVYRAIWGSMVVLTAMATMVLLLTTPLRAEEGEFIHALRSGEISSVAVGHSADFFSGSALQTVPSNAQDDIAVSWVNRYGFRREAVLNRLQPLGAGIGTTPSTPPLDPSASIVRTAQSLGAAAPTVVLPGELPLDRFTWLSGIATFLMIFLMLGGPQPRRTTRWGAFWAYLAPLNIGIFYGLLRDSPWRPGRSLPPEPLRGDRVVVNPVTNQSTRRDGGGVMFFWSIVMARVAVYLVLLALAGALPTYVDPVVWSAVDIAGSPLR